MRVVISIIIMTIFVIVTNTSGQTIFVPLDNDIYEYLDRLSIKGIIELNDEVKPMTRRYISGKLMEISNKKSELSSLEKQELIWYLEEYSEVNTEYKKGERWYLYKYQDSLFNISVLPFLGYGISYLNNEAGHIKWPGTLIWGSYSNWFGAAFSYVDRGEFGERVDKEKRVSQETGGFYKKVDNGIETSDVNGLVSFDWGWGNVSLVKDHQSWGHGRFGQIILSNKAPSFPQIRLFLNPTKWMRFHYIHSWLNSLMLDSASFYYNHLNSQKPYLKEKYINKYYVANFISISVNENIDFSFGNSFVYSGDLRPEMFIPFMYYKVMDHVTGRGDVDDGNGALFFDAKVNYFKNISLYASLFADVIEIREILNGNWNTSWLGYTIGLKNIDFVIPKADLTVEYTKTDQWLYEHKDQSTTYKNYNYPLGHWIGQNSDFFRVQFDYQFIRGLKFSIYGDRIRNGGLKDIYYAYQERVHQPFLYSPKRNEYTIGLTMSYEPIHGLRIQSKYRHSSISDEEVSRTPIFMIGKSDTFSLLMQYGL